MAEHPELAKLKAMLKAREGKREYRESIPIIKAKIAAIEASLAKREAGE